MNGLVFALIYLAKATTIFMNMSALQQGLINEVLPTLPLLPMFQISMTIQTTQFRNHEREWNRPEAPQPPRFLVTLLALAQPRLPPPLPWHCLGTFSFMHRSSLLCVDP